MTRGVQQRITDILDAIERCRRYADLLDVDDDLLAQMAQDAVERTLQIVGEAASHLPTSFTAARPEVNWAAIRGFRNILVHEYFHLDHKTVRDVITAHLAPLAEALRQTP